MSQRLWVGGPEDRGDGEDAEGGAAGESQADGEQSEFTTELWPQSFSLSTSRRGQSLRLLQVSTSAELTFLVFVHFYNMFDSEVNQIIEFMFLFINKH